MTLPNSYTIKTGAIPDYFEAILNAEPPERFSHKFLEGIGFSSSNDRLIIGILKELGFLTTDGRPTDRYFEFLDRQNSPKIVAEGIKEAYSDLFAVNTSAHELSAKDAENKLRTLYKGEKKDTVIKNISKTFVALCDYADFTKKKSPTQESQPSDENSTGDIKQDDGHGVGVEAPRRASLERASLQYHINIVLPDSRDQAVYGAIFKSLRDHLG